MDFQQLSAEQKRAAVLEARDELELELAATFVALDNYIEGSYDMLKHIDDSDEVVREQQLIKAAIRVQERVAVALAIVNPDEMNEW